MSIIRREFLLLAGAVASGIHDVHSGGRAGAGRRAQTHSNPAQGIGGARPAGRGERCQRVEFGPGAAAPWHMHPGAQEILYALDGNLVVEVEGQPAAIVKAGECSVIPADVPHLARNDSGTASTKALVVHSRSAKDKPPVVAVKRAA